MHTTGSLYPRSVTLREAKGISVQGEMLRRSQHARLGALAHPTLCTGPGIG